MSMRIGTYGNQSVKRYEIKKADGTVSGSITITTSKAKKKKKKVQYNFKEISGRILKAKTSGMARQTLVSARQKVVSLRRMWIVRSGVYDDQELYHAIVHAEAIARVAKKRLKHLQEEERADKEGGPCEAEQEEETKEIFTEELFDGEQLPGMDPEELQELMQECQELLQEAMEELERLENGMSDLAEELMYADTEDMDPADLEQLKRKHRADEMREIMLADMRYLKAMFDKLAKEKESGSSGIGEGSAGDSSANAGVSLELGGLDIPVTPSAPEAAELVEGATVDASV
ncbi:MAG: hypothetical protein NC432_11315 [Roseburia sp.]|nr:hypothetical protein [Roseburia sp.]MCM1096458.1 hypothetical protein [Ruminococcus flavefaciens]